MCTILQREWYMCHAFMELIEIIYFSSYLDQRRFTINETMRLLQKIHLLTFP